VFKGDGFFFVPVFVVSVLPLLSVVAVVCFAFLVVVDVVGVESSEAKISSTADFVDSVFSAAFLAAAFLVVFFAAGGLMVEFSSFGGVGVTVSVLVSLVVVLDSMLFSAFSVGAAVVFFLTVFLGGWSWRRK